MLVIVRALQRAGVVMLFRRRGGLDGMRMVSVGMIVAVRMARTSPAFALAIRDNACFHTEAQRWMQDEHGPDKESHPLRSRRVACWERHPDTSFLSFHSGQNAICGDQRGQCRLSGEWGIPAGDVRMLTHLCVRMPARLPRIETQ